MRMFKHQNIQTHPWKEKAKNSPNHLSKLLSAHLGASPRKRKEVPALKLSNFLLLLPFPPAVPPRARGCPQMSVLGREMVETDSMNLISRGMDGDLWDSRADSAQPGAWGHGLRVGLATQVLG